ncbi:MAG: rod shape-determining protein MreD [Clostridia bacterium]|nr:rod shape-determining protein MreD [Clostridia bacterium]
MRTRRRIICIVLTLLTLLLDSSVLPFTGLDMRFVPRLCLVAVVLIGTVLGATEGIAYGAFAGILLDITVYQPAGLVAVFYTLCGLIAGFLSGRLRPYLVTVVPLTAAYLFFEIGMAIYVYFTVGTFPASQLPYAFLRLLVALFALQLLYLPAIKLMKPASIGRARR